MNALKHYNSLISKAQGENRSKQYGIFEKHHIIPKCLGGSDENDNLVLLTPREHFIAHLLLWKTDVKNQKLFAPLLFFKRNKHVKSSRTYEHIRNIHIFMMREQNPSLFLSEESRSRKSKKLSEYAKNRPIEVNERISKANSGKQPRLGAKLSEETKNKISESVKLFYATTGTSLENREKISKALTGKKHTEKAKQHWSLAAKNRTKYVCPLCNKDNLDGGNFNLHMKRVHKWTSEMCQSFKEGWTAPNHLDNLGRLTDLKNK